MSNRSSLKSFWSRLLYDCCSLAVAIIILPFNFLYDLVSIRSEFGLETTPREHERRVGKVQEQVEQWIRLGNGPVRPKMCTARPSWKTSAVSKTDKSKYFQVSVNLGQIVKLDVGNKTVTVEPGVMMGQISRYLFKRGWTIEMVPEMETLTVGGLICGGGMDTGGHKLGIFPDTVLSYEVVLPTGDVVTCSKENDPDLFYAMCASQGTIGFLTAITIPVIPATRYVKVDYRFVTSLSEFHALMKSEPNHDFVEGFAFSQKEIVLMFGDRDDGDDAKIGNNPTKTAIKVHHINRWYEEPYYKQVKAIMKTKLGNDSFMEYIPLVQYYHRHSRAMFWIVDTSFPVLFSRIGLFLLGWTLPLNFHFQVLLPSSLWKLFASGKVVHDYIVPMERADELFQTGHELLEVYPVWIGPLKPNLNTLPISSSRKDEYYVDVNFMGDPHAPGFNGIATLKAMENKCLQCEGFLSPYANIFLSKEQYLEMLDSSLYDKVRRERGCEAAFPHRYDKIGPKGRNLTT